MPAAKCYCRPQRESLPQWPCEDASTAVNLCCLSATVYDVRCYWNTETFRGDYIDHSPGDTVGSYPNGEPIINCPESGQNTNLNGVAFFWFPDRDIEDQINPWRPCPVTCESDEAWLPRNCRTGAGVQWRYSCDTGLVKFTTFWLVPNGQQPVLNPGGVAIGEVSVDPDWYVGGEVDIPWNTAASVNYVRPRFSVKLKMTCEAQDPCQQISCLPPCVVRDCPETGNQHRPLYLTVTGCADLAALAPETFPTVDGGGFQSGTFGYGVTSPPGEPPVAQILIQYGCSASGLVRDVYVDDTDGGSYTVGPTLVSNTCSGGSWSDTFTLDLVDCGIVTFDVFSDGMDTWEPV